MEQEQVQQRYHEARRALTWDILMHGGALDMLRMRAEVATPELLLQAVQKAEKGYVCSAALLLRTALAQEERSANDELLDTVADTMKTALENEAGLYDAQVQKYSSQQGILSWLRRDQPKAAKFEILRERSLDRVRRWAAMQSQVAA